MARERALWQIVDLLDAGCHVELIGDFGSGRTRVMRLVAEQLTAVGWEAIIIRGQRSLRNVPLAALSLSGLASSNLCEAVTALRERFTRNNRLIVVDDADEVDEQTWAVVSLLCAERSVALLAVRSQHRSTARVMPSPVTRVVLDEVSHDVLGSILATDAKRPIASDLVAHIHMLTVGNIGLARALLGTATQAGRVAVGEEVEQLHSLWTPLMAPSMEALLLSCSPEEVAALERLVMLGPAPLTVASRATSHELLDSLGDRGLIHIRSIDDVTSVEVRIPLLRHYFFSRHVNTIRVLHVSADLSERLGYELMPTAHPGVSSESLLLSHQQRRRVQVAAEAWRDQPSKGSGLSYMRALAAVEPNGERLAEVVEASRNVGGSRQTSRAWAQWWSLHLARNNRLTEGLRYVSDDPQWAGYLTAGYDRVLDADDSCALRALLSGRIHTAVRLLSLRDEPGGRAEKDAVLAVAHMANGDFGTADRIASIGLQHAAASLDAAAIRIYTYAGALSGLLSLRLSVTETYLKQAQGLPPDGNAQVYEIALRNITRLLRVVQGVPVVEGPMEEPLETAMGPLPLMSQAWGTAADLWARGNMDEARSVLQAHADDAWARGNRLNAAYASAALVMSRPAAVSSQTLARVMCVDGRWALEVAPFFRAVQERDAQGIQFFAEQFDLKQVPEAASFIWRWVAQVTGSETALARASRLQAAHLDYDARSLPSSLTAREREVVQFVIDGMTNQQVAERLFISPRTAESHIARAMKKCGVSSRGELRRRYQAAASRRAERARYSAATAADSVMPSSLETSLALNPQMSTR